MNRDKKVLGLGIILGLIVFYIDLLLPLGIAAGVLYVIVILVLGFQSDQRNLWVAAVFATALTIIGYYLSSPQDQEHYKVLTNRFLAILVIWATALLTNRIIKIKQQLISEQQEHIQSVESALAEKEILLKEIHHRVKNNLQILKSLLSLQSGNLNDEQSIGVMETFKQRIISISLVHEHLYSTRTFNHVKLSEFIKDLIKNIEIAQADPDSVVFDLDIEELDIDLDKAVPIGLILNEAISNSLKYAFENHPDNNIIEVKLHHTANGAELEIGDNGKGMTPNQKPRENALGLSLIEILTEQIGGVLQKSTELEKGVHYKITF